MEKNKMISPFQTISILSISFMMYAAGSLIAPALNALQEEFPDTPFTTIRMIMTSMYLSILVFSLISGRLGTIMSKKLLVIIGLAIYGTMGLVGANLSSVPALMTCRIIMGCGVGLVLPQATAIILLFYEGKEKERYTGFATGISNLGSMIGSIVGGAAAAMSWRYNFYCFAFSFVIMLLVMIGVPSTPIPEKKPKTERVKNTLPSGIWLLSLGMVLIQIYSLVTPTNMARFYLGEGLGPASLLGITMAFLTGSGFAGGFILPQVRHIFRDKTALLGCVLTGIGFLILWKTTSVYTTILAQICIGFANGILTPMIFIGNARLSKPDQLPITNSIMSSSLYLGCFLTAYIQNGIGAVSGNTSQRFMFAVFGAGAFLIAIVVAIIQKSMTHK